MLVEGNHIAKIPKSDAVGGRGKNCRVRLSLATAMSHTCDSRRQCNASGALRTTAQTVLVNFAPHFAPSPPPWGRCEIREPLPAWSLANFWKQFGTQTAVFWNATSGYLVRFPASSLLFIERHGHLAEVWYVCIGFLSGTLAPLGRGVTHRGHIRQRLWGGN